MMKPGCLLLGLCVFSGAVFADPTDPCAGLEGSALTQCRGYQQTLRQEERLEQLLQQQQERQNQLDQQQREVQQQLQNMRLQNESLRKELERETAKQAAQPIATDSPKNTHGSRPDGSSPDVKNAELKSWKADNPWFGSDYARTQFAMHYTKQLQQERPDLAGRDLLDAVSTKVNETFAAKH